MSRDECAQTLISPLTMLKQYSAVIEMNRSKLFLKTNDVEWTAGLIDSDSTTPNRAVYHIQGSLDRQEQVQNSEIFYELDNEQLWNDKIDEICTFQREKTNANLNLSLIHI